MDLTNVCISAFKFLRTVLINNHNALTHISRNQKAQLLQNLMNDKDSPDFSDSEYNVGLIFLH